MDRDAPEAPGSSVAAVAIPNICMEMVSPAFRSSIISLEKWLKDSRGATVEAWLAAPLISSRVPLARAAVVLRI